MPEGEARGTFLYCDPTDPEQDRSPAKFQRLQLLENERLVYRQYLALIPLNRMHGDDGFLRNVLCDQTIGLSNRGYIILALHALERANFVPRGSSDRWENIFRSRDPLMEARRSEAGPSAARPTPAPRPPAPDPIVNPFLVRVNDPFQPPFAERPATPSSARSGVQPRTQSATTDPDIHSRHSPSTSEDSLRNPSSTTSSDSRSSPSSSIGRDSPRNLASRTNPERRKSSSTSAGRGPTSKPDQRPGKGRSAQ